MILFLTLSMCLLDVSVDGCLDMCFLRSVVTTILELSVQLVREYSSVSIRGLYSGTRLL